MTKTLTAGYRNAIFIASLLVVSGGFGCAARTGVEEPDAPVASQEQDLTRGGGGISLGYTCTPDGTCTCDKSIENDCENMSGICREKDLDNLINCINGWLTTHCTCVAGLVRPPTTGVIGTVGGVKTTAVKASF